MTQGKTGDKVKEPEVKALETPETKEPQTLSPQEELDTLRQQLKDAEAGKTKAEEEAKAHQKNVSKKDLELQEAKHISESIDEMKDRLEMQETYIAQLGDKVAGEGGQGFAQQVRASQVTQKRATLTRKADSVAREVDGLLKDTGLTKDSPELKSAGLLYSMGTQTGNSKYLDDALREVKEVIAKHQPKTEEGKKVDEKKETEEERIERLAEEKYQEKLEAKGLKTPEGGEPSGGGGETFTVQQIADMSPEEFEEKQEAINKARRGGNIKQ